MAREYVGEMAVELAHDGQDLPDSVYTLPAATEDEVVTLVDVNVKAIAYGIVSVFLTGRLSLNAMYSLTFTSTNVTTSSSVAAGNV